MTDNDDSPPPRDLTSPDGLGKDDPRQRTARPGEPRVRWGRGSGTGAHVAPTDPEVPRAKRRGARRRQRSLVGLTAVVMSLVSITLALLYRASQRVAVGEPSGFGMPLRDGTSANDAVPPPALAREGSFTRLAPPPPAASGIELADDVPAGDRASSDSAPVGSGSPHLKAPPPATGIIRTPAF